MSGPGPVEKLQALDNVEKEIIACITSAGQALAELSKDKPSIKQMDQQTSSFLKTLNKVEIEMAKHINYLTQVSTGHSHEGSSYASQKVLQMAWHRSEHARSRVLELERMKTQMLAMAATSRQLAIQGRGGPPPAAAAAGPSASSSHPPTPTTGQQSQGQVMTPQTPSSTSH